MSCLGRASLQEFPSPSFFLLLHRAASRTAHHTQKTYLHTPRIFGQCCHTNKLVVSFCCECVVEGTTTRASKQQQQQQLAEALSYGNRASRGKRARERREVLAPFCGWSICGWQQRRAVVTKASSLHHNQPTNRFILVGGLIDTNLFLLFLIV